jgi:hypothetical protein
MCGHVPPRLFPAQAQFFGLLRDGLGAGDEFLG